MTIYDQLKNKTGHFDLKIIWFLAIGGLNTLVGFGLFPCVYGLFSTYRDHYIIMLSICHIINVSIAYFTNKFLVFRTKGDYSKEMLKFISFHVVYFIFVILLVPFLVDLAKVSPVVIQFSISVLVVCLSFFWYDKVVFFTEKSNLN